MTVPQKDLASNNSKNVKKIVIHTNQMDGFNGGTRFNEMTALALHKNGYEVEIYTNGYSDSFVSDEFAKKIKGIFNKFDRQSFGNLMS